MAVDFLIFTALPKEWEPLQKVFNPTRVEKFNRDPTQYYETVIKNEMTDPYSAVLFTADKKGPGISACLVRALEKWKPRHLILVGIAATIPKTNRGLGDILVADMIVDLTEAALSPGSTEYRSKPPISCERELITEVIKFKSKFNKKNVHTGPIIAQPNIIRYAKIRNAYAKKAREVLGHDAIGIEMEGGGVSAAVEAFVSYERVGFTVIKGAVDYANYLKKDTFQKSAARDAAKFLKVFLKFGPVGKRGKKTTSEKQKDATVPAIPETKKTSSPKDQKIPDEKVGVGFPYDHSAEEYKILLRQLVIEYRDGNGNRNNLDSYIDSMQYLLDRIFSPFPMLRKSASVRFPEHFLSVKEGDDLHQSDVNLNDGVIKINSTEDLKKIWGSEAKHLNEAANIFEFVLTDLKIEFRENKHGVLYELNAGEIPGRHALFSLSNVVSAPKKINVVPYYKDIRLGIFLVRNMIRSFGGSDFVDLHRKPEHKRCLMYNPGSDPNDTYDWIMGKLNFGLCNDCEKALSSSIKRRDVRSIVLQKVIPSIQNACIGLYNMRLLIQKKPI